MKSFWASFGGQVAAALLPVALVGIIGLLIWRRLFGAQTATDVVNNVIDSAATIPSGLTSLVGSAIRGESEATYITQAQQTQLAAEALARKQGRLGP